ncbi:MAG: class I SAM-dependent methyltransferase [Gemmatimonadota bacterium]|nr:class I SAM-dependent methyltransferase [Gemmatimonadota bacterium]
MLIDRISSSLAFRLSSNKRKVARQWRKLRSASDSQGESKYSRFARELEACAGPLAGKRLLEIGSDTDGNLLRACIERGNLSSAVGVNPAITRNLEAGKIQMLGVDARSLPFPESSFDMAVSLSVFEHVFDLSAVLEECHRVLKPAEFFMRSSVQSGRRAGGTTCGCITVAKLWIGAHIRCLHTHTCS